MRQRLADLATPRALAGAAVTLLSVALAACGSDRGADVPALAAGGAVVAQQPSRSAAPTPPAYTGTRINLANSDNGTHIAATIGSDLLVQVNLPLQDDCQGTHMCAVWQVDDAGGVLLRAQEMTTCDTDACTAQREVFLERAGTATLSLVGVRPCSPSEGSRCELLSGPTLWSAHVSVGSAG